MEPVTYEALAAARQLRTYEKAFYLATKVSLKLLPPDEARRRANLRQSENPFCALVASTQAGCEACLENQRRAERSLAGNLDPQQCCCFAGLTDIAVPVKVGDRHVATLLSGQILCQKPRARDFEKVLKKIGKPPDKGWIKKAREAYFATPVISKSSLEAIIQLITMFAERLPDDANRQLMMSQPKREPDSVSSAKSFIASHAAEDMTLGRVLQHVHVSRFHFCRIFKQATGITLTEYIARIRVEKAKALLLDSSARVSEIVFAAGFGSVPQFNSVFRRFVGMSPTQYRRKMQKIGEAGRSAKRTRRPARRLLTAATA